MARTLGDVVRRGAENVLANWPLLLIRVAESVAMIVITLGIVFGAIAPLVATMIGGSFSDLLAGAEDLEGLLLRTSPLIAIYVLLVVSLVLFVAVLVHSFVQGGIVGCYLEAERSVPADGATRGELRVFTPELWWSEGKRNLWPFFWIYNVMWGIWSLAILLPLLPLLILLVLFPGSPGAIVLAIVGFLAILLLAIGLAFVVFLWSQVVLIDSAKRGTRALEAIAASRASMRGRLGNIILVGGIFFALSMTVGTALAGFTFFVETAGAVPGMGVALIPVQILLSLVNSAVSTMFGCWLLAALAAALADLPTEVRHDVAPA